MNGLLVRMGLMGLLLAGSQTVLAAGDGKLISTSLVTNKLPSGVLEYAVWEPPGYQPGQSVPLIINLHGGGGSQDHLESLLPTISKAMGAGDFPAAIWSTPSAARSFYMNTKDGTALWETVIVEAYLPALMRRYGIVDRHNIVIIGVSMGGMGGLRMAFKYPEKFGAVAVLEPAIEAALHWADVTPLDTFYREGVYPTIFGDPVDPGYWAANHPTAIANADPRALDDLNIYFEVGDLDDLRLYRGGEFLHRVLFDHGVKHEYRLVRGADHVSSEFMMKRFADLLGFVNRHFNPVEAGLRSRAVKKALSLFAGGKELGPDGPLSPHREMVERK